MKKKLKKGFTLVELVIVIAVIAILSAVLIPTFGNVISNANEAAAKEEVSNAITQYTANQGSSVGDGYIILFNKAQTVTGADLSNTYKAANIDRVFSFFSGRLEMVTSYTIDDTSAVSNGKFTLKVKREGESAESPVTLTINGLSRVTDTSWKAEGTAVLDGVASGTGESWKLSGKIVLLQVATTTGG